MPAEFSAIRALLASVTPLCAFSASSMLSPSATVPLPTSLSDSIYTLRAISCTASASGGLTLIVVGMMAARIFASKRDR